ncbi:MAG: Mov34/MPN/PAD-1 family protein [Pyrinomonadaceae bacterium]|nr:M67 family metallopeptidase [Acidobacteriota bacterium]
MIQIGEDILIEIENHAERDFPHECGGMLIGKFTADGMKSVFEIFPMENAREAADRHNRVLILPKDVMRAERHAREKGFDVVGYYHSHPNAPAVPSQYDLDHALPVWSYLIISVLNGKAVDTRSWEMEDDRSKFIEEKIQKQELTTDGHR